VPPNTTTVVLVPVLYGIHSPQPAFPAAVLYDTSIWRPTLSALLRSSNTGSFLLRCGTKFAVSDFTVTSLVGLLETLPYPYCRAPRVKLPGLTERRLASIWAMCLYIIPVTSFMLTFSLASGPERCSPPVCVCGTNSLGFRIPISYLIDRNKERFRSSAHEFLPLVYA